MPGILLLVYILECVWFIHTQSLTYDEPPHIRAGLEAWRDHRFEVWNDHPPLARFLCTLLVIDRRWQIDVESAANGGWHVRRVAPDPESLAHRARSMNVLLGIILAILVWSTARGMFSWGAANLTLALFVFSPPLIAHFSLATTDGAAALFVFAVAVGLIWWRKQPSMLHTALFGMLLGLLLLAKFSTPPIFVLALGWMLVLRPEGLCINPRRWNWGKTCAAVLTAVLILWAGYFFHISHVSINHGELSVTFPNRAPYVHKVRASNLNVAFPLPAGEYFEGLNRVFQHNKRGHPVFFLGQVSQRGSLRLYYPVTVLLKWPAIALVLFAAGLALVVVRALPAPSGLWIASTFPALYFGLALFARLNLGERHVLPVYPFMLLFVAAVWETLHVRRWAKLFVLAVVLLQAADELRYAPDDLAYFNFFIQPSENFNLLSGSNLDWGQGLLAVRDYENTHPGETISLAYFGSVEPQIYGIHAPVLREQERATGTVIVGATNLSGEYLKDPASYRWVLKYPRRDILDHSLWVFQVPSNQHFQN
ncbi:MAG: hypothetical protein DMG69_02450 [Acidobacteria bacterium]|nr:MAG: hypothetical protein DMG69_02450 [Acidobacteriota bacterium]